MPQLSQQERVLDREMHTVFTQAHGGDGFVPSPAIYEVRRRRQRPWRYMGRRLREMREADVPKEQAKEIVRVFELYIDQLYSSGAA